MSSTDLLPWLLLKRCGVFALLYPSFTCTSCFARANRCEARLARSSTGPEASHRLLHIVADGTIRMQHIMFASQWVADEFAKKAMSDELQVGQQFPCVGSCLVLGFA